MDKQQPQATQTYTHYAAVVAAHGVTPMTEAQFAACASLPRVADVPMPHSLNYAIGVALEAGDMFGAVKMINQCDEHDRECWTQYTTEGDHFPAGGLHFNQFQWSHFGRTEARPLNVAHMLDFDGNAIGELTFFTVGSESCFFDKDSVCCWDNELGWDFLFHHFTENPTLEQIIELTKPHFGEQG